MGIPTALADDPWGMHSSSGGSIQLVAKFVYRSWIFRWSDGKHPGALPSGAGWQGGASGSQAVPRLGGDPHCRVAAMLSGACRGSCLASRTWDHHGGAPIRMESPHGFLSALASRCPVGTWESGWLPVAWGEAFQKVFPSAGSWTVVLRSPELFVEARVILGVDLNELEMVWLPLPQNRKETDAQPKNQPLRVPMHMPHSSFSSTLFLTPALILALGYAQSRACH